MPSTVHRLSLKRALAALLLPASLLPVVLLAPSLVRAPATLALRAERPLARAVARALTPAKTHREPPEPRRYPIGAARLEVDVFHPVAGAFTPQVGVSPLVEHEWAQERANRPIVLVTGEREARSAP